MTQEEKWNGKYDEVMEFLEKNQRNPSRHRIEEHDMLNWVKHNRKLQNAGMLKPERVRVFNQLMAKMEECKRKNQWG